MVGGFKFPLLPIFEAYIQGMRTSLQDIHDIQGKSRHISHTVRTIQAIQAIHPIQLIKALLPIGRVRLLMVACMVYLRGEKPLVSASSHCSVDCIHHVSILQCIVGFLQASFFFFTLSVFVDMGSSGMDHFCTHAHTPYRPKSHRISAHTTLHFITLSFHGYRHLFRMPRVPGKV